MLVKEFNKLLEAEENCNLPVHLALPNGKFIPSHYHVTEVGKVQKTFVDCGGTQREVVSCLLQVWTAHDIDHSLKAGKLLKIMRMAEKVLETDDMPVEIEYGAEVASQYAISESRATPYGLMLLLSGKQTDCLAPDKCGVNKCKPGSGCC